MIFQLIPKVPTTYLPEELETLNHKLVIHLEYQDVKEKLHQLAIDQIDEKFWICRKAEFQKLSDNGSAGKFIQILKRELQTCILIIAAEILPGNY